MGLQALLCFALSLYSLAAYLFSRASPKFLFCYYLAVDTTVTASDFMFQISDFCIRSSFHLSQQVRQLVLPAPSVVGASLFL